MKPSAQQYEAALAAGEAARRAGRSLIENPYRKARDEPWITLDEAWESGWERFDRWLRSK